MKKIFTLAALALCTGVFAQSFSIYKTNNAGIPTATIMNGGGFQETTTPNGAALETKILLKNNAATTQSFNVTRSIVMQNPSLILDGSSNTPNTYFCFGYNCFGSNTSQPDPSNYTILLAAGQGSSTGFPNADNSKENGQPFVLYFTEGANQGNYIVRYRVYNVDPTKPNDTLSFRVGYNQYVGIKNNTTVSATLSADIYPNPTDGSSKLYMDLAKDDEIKVQVYNNLGSLVASTSKQKFAAGKNVLPVNTAELSNGVYFITISGNTATATKRLIVNR